MGTYKILRGSIGQYKDGMNHIAKPGESVELTKAQAAARVDLLGPMVELVDLDALEAISDAKTELLSKQAGKGKKKAQKGDGDGSESLVGHLNMADAVAFIEALEDEEVLDAVEAEEVARKTRARKGVLSVIAKVRAEFDSDGDEE